MAIQVEPQVFHGRLRFDFSISACQNLPPLLCHFPVPLFRVASDSNIFKPNQLVLRHGCSFGGWFRSCMLQRSPKPACEFFFADVRFLRESTGRGAGIGHRLVMPCQSFHVGMSIAGVGDKGMTCGPADHFRSKHTMMGLCCMCLLIFQVACEVPGLRQGLRMLCP